MCSPRDDIDDDGLARYTKWTGVNERVGYGCPGGQVKEHPSICVHIRVCVCVVREPVRIDEVHRCQT